MWRVIKADSNVDLWLLCTPTHTRFPFLSRCGVWRELTDRVLRNQQDPGCLTWLSADIQGLPASLLWTKQEPGRCGQMTSSDLMWPRHSSLSPPISH